MADNQISQVIHSEPFLNSEERYRCAFEDIGVGMLMLELDGTFRWVNRAFYEMLGYSRDEIMSKGFADITYPNDLRKGINVLKRMNAGEISSANFQKRYVHKNGQPIWVQLNASMVFDDDGTAMYTICHVHDISQQKMDEAASQANEERYRRSFADALIGMTVVETNGKFRLVNPAFCKMLGYTIEEMQTKSIHDITHPDDTGADAADRNWLFEGEIDHPAFEKRYIRKDGGVVWGLTTRTVITDDDGTPLYTIGQVIDITARKIAEEALQQSEARFKDFAECAADRFWVTDDTHRFINLSDVPGDSSFIQSDNLLGKTRWEFGQIQKDDENWRNHRADMDAHRPFKNFRYSCTTEDGSVGHFQVSGNPVFSENGAFNGYRGTARDETEEVLARDNAASIQRQFNNAMDQSANGIVLWDANGKLVMCNEHFRDSHSHLADVLKPGLQYEDFLRCNAESGELDSAVGREGEFIAAGLKSFEDKKDLNEEIQYGKRWFRIRRQFLPDDSAIVFQSDITKEKKRDEQLRHSQKMEAIGQLTAGISHDFNNILGAILGNIELVASGIKDDPLAMERLGRAQRIVMRGSDLTDRLLAFSRKQHLKPKETSINDLLSETCHLMEWVLGEEITVRLNLSEDDPVSNVDPSQLENAILNLAINSRDAMPNGGVLKLSVETIHVDHNRSLDYPQLRSGDYARLTIKDTGQGILPENLDKVFEPFFTTKEFGRGNGLGLSMVHGFVKQSGGHIEIDSEWGKGTKISIYLPRSSAQEVAMTGKIDEAPIPVGRGERIMVVEDDPDIREITIYSLEMLGYEVIDGDDGSQAIKIAKEQQSPIDVLLTDVVLPNGNTGPELARKISFGDIEIMVVLMTGYAQAELFKSMDENVKYTILKKPFQQRQLAMAIYDVIHPG